MSEQARAFTLGTREVISWKSQDGTTIEGVLIKPANFDATKKYPLVCIIHGGPTGVDRPLLLTPDSRYYPADIWAARGALILKVNYRGSAGYGEVFRKLNVRNLGVGDAWDVLSGIDYLISKGWVDQSKVGCMGWSQGGYISAFLTTSSNRFAAISVGAGISNWATYYYNNRHHAFLPSTISATTRCRSGDLPEDFADVLHQVCEDAHIDPTRRTRSPRADSQRLRTATGPRDRGVKVEMVVYKGFGHGHHQTKIDARRDAA